MTQPGNLERRAELEDRYTLREPQAPVEEPKGFDDQEKVSQTPEPEATAAPPVVPPPVNPKGIFEAITDSFRRTGLHAEADKTYAQARRAEVRGDGPEYDRLRSESEVKRAQAGEITPGVDSFANVRSLRDAGQYAGELGGSVAESVIQSTAGGVLGGTAGGIVASALALTPLGKLRYLAKTLKYGGAFAGGIIPMAEQTKGSIAHRQDTDPEIAKHSVADRESAANLTTAGSLALEGLVPTLIGGRVGGKVLAQGRQKLGLPTALQGATTNKGLLALNSIEEGATEVLQGELEAFSLHLQNPSLPTSEGLTAAIDAFLGGMVGGAMGHGIGRTAELGADLISSLEFAAPGGANFANLKIDQEMSSKFLQGLPEVLRGHGFVDLANEIHEFKNNRFESDQRGQELGVIADYLKATLIEKGRAADIDPADDDARILTDKLGRYRTDMREDFITALGGKKDRVAAEMRAIELEAMIDNILMANNTNKTAPEQEIDETEEDEYNPTIADTIEDELREAMDFGANEASSPSQRAAQIEDPLDPTESRVDSGGGMDSTFDGTQKEFDYSGFQSVPAADPQSGRHAATGTRQSTSFERPVNVHSNIEKGRYEGMIEESPYTSEYKNAFSNEETRNVREEDMEFVSWGKWLEHKARQVDSVHPLSREASYIEMAKNLVKDYQARIDGNNNSDPARAAEVIGEHRGKIDELKRALDVGFESVTGEDGKVTQGLNQLLNETYKIGIVKRQEFKEGPSASDVMSNQEAGRVQEPFNRLNLEDNTEEGRREVAAQRKKIVDSAIPVVRRLTAADRRHLAQQRVTETKTLEEALEEVNEFDVVFMPRRGFMHVQKTFLARDKTLNTATEGTPLGSSTADIEGKRVGGKEHKAQSKQELLSGGLARFMARPDVVGIAVRNPDGSIKLDSKGQPMLEKARSKATKPEEGKVEFKPGEHISASQVFKEDGSREALNNAIPFGLIIEGENSSAYSDDQSAIAYRREIKQAKVKYQSTLEKFDARLERFYKDLIKPLRPELQGKEPNDPEVAEAARPDWWKISSTERMLNRKDQREVSQTLADMVDEYISTDRDQAKSLREVLEQYPESEFAGIFETLNELKEAHLKVVRVLDLLIENPGQKAVAPFLEGLGKRDSLTVETFRTYDVRKVLKAARKKQLSYLAALSEPSRDVDSAITDDYKEARAYYDISDAAEDQQLAKTMAASGKNAIPGDINELEVRLRRLQEADAKNSQRLKTLLPKIQPIDEEADTAFDEAVFGINDAQEIDLKDVTETEKLSLEDYSILAKQYLQEYVSRQMSDAHNIQPIAKDEHTKNIGKLYAIAEINSPEHVEILTDLMALGVDELFDAVPENEFKFPESDDVREQASLRRKAKKAERKQSANQEEIAALKKRIKQGYTKLELEEADRKKAAKAAKKRAALKKVKKTRWQGIVGKTNARVLKSLKTAHEFSTRLREDRVLWNQMSSREHGAAAKAFGLISTRKGVSGVNVTNMGSITHNNVVMLLLDVLPSGRTNTYLKKAMDNHAAVMLSSQSEVYRDKKLYAKFRDYMFEEGYGPSLNDPLFFDSVSSSGAVRQAAEFNAAMIAIQAQVDNNSEAINKDEAPEETIWLHSLLWRLEVILADQPSRNNKGGRRYDISGEERSRLKTEYGYELSWSNQFTRGLNTKSVPQDESTEQKRARSRWNKNAIPSTGEKSGSKARTKARKKREKNPDYISPEQAAQNIRDKNWADEQQKAAEGMYAAFQVPRGADTHVHMAHFFRSIGISNEERRMRRDLKRTISKNSRIYRAVQLHLVENPYGLSDKQKSAMMSDANENLYYGYVFQMWINDEVKLGPTPEQWFRRILKWIAKMIGGHTAEYFSEEFFTALSLGQIQSNQQIAEFYKQHSSDLDTRISDMNEIVRRGVLRTVATGIDVLRELNIEEANEIADLFAPGEYTQGFKGDGFLPKRQQQINAWQNRFRNKLLKKYGEEKLDAGWAQYRIGDTSSEVSRDIEKFVDEFYRYMDKRGVQLRELDSKGNPIYVKASERSWKVPAAWDSASVTKDRGEFHKLLVMNGMDEEQATKYIDSMLWAGGHVSFVDSKWDKESKPYGTGAFSGYSQVLNVNNAKDFAKFMSNDGMFAMNRMVQQGVHKAEFSARFGDRGQKLEQFYDRLEKRGLSEARINFIKTRTIPGLLGSMTFNLHPKVRRSMGSFIAIQNMAILPMILFSSMPEIWGNAIASQDFNQAFKAAKEGFAEIGRSMKYGKEGPNQESELEQIGRMVGAISDEMVTNRITDVFHDMMAGTQIRNWNEKFFRLTMIEQWTKGLRLAAVQAAISFITDHQANEVKLHQLGLKPGDLSFHPDGSLDTKNLDDPDNAVSMAIYKFVDQAVLRPSSAHRPAWGSDPRFLFVWHLKQFTFSFHQVFTKHIAKQFASRDWKDNPDRGKVLLAYMMMLPTIILSDMVKNIVAPSTWYWSGRMTFEQFMYLETSRSGIAGIGSLFLDEMLSKTFHQPFGKNFMGPSFEWMLEFIDGKWAKSVLKLTPGYVLWHKWGLL